MRYSAQLFQGLWAIAAVLPLVDGSNSVARAQARTQLTVGVTDNVNSFNPVADSAAFMASGYRSDRTSRRCGNEIALAVHSVATAHEADVK